MKVTALIMQAVVGTFLAQKPQEPAEAVFISDR
mgnify:CR=1 FL=1